MILICISSPLLVTRHRRVCSPMYGLSPSSRTSSLRNWLPTPVRRIRRLTPHPKCAFNSVAPPEFKLCMAQMKGSTTTYLSQVSNCAQQVPRPPQPTPRADQPVVEIASSEDDASSDEEREGSDDNLSSSDDSSTSSSSVEEEQSAPAGGR